MTTKHYSEADLLETVYVQPCLNVPVMMHLEQCSECAARYDRLQEKLRGLATCETEKPATFWTRQRLSIMRTIDANRQHAESAWRTTRIAAAAVLAFLLGGAVVYKSVEPALKQPAVVIAQPTVTPAATDEIQIPRDPWQSDELKDFHGVVQWESWVAQGKAGAKGETSL
jgi:hypothetical protein